MKSNIPSPDPLDRLLRSASRTPAPACKGLPFPAEARVLAAWRRSRSDTPSAGLGLWLRAGFAGAVLVAALTVAVCWSSVRPQAGDEYAVANATLYVALAP